MADVAPFLPDVLLRLNVGVVALGLNLAVVALVTLATRGWVRAPVAESSS